MKVLAKTPLLLFVLLTSNPEALNGTGFLTVVGAGLSGDVRLMKEETEACLFQWQDMSE
jgi:hypothetical protein